VSVGLNVSVMDMDKGARKHASAGLGPWLARAAPKAARGQVTVAIVPDATMQRLNKRFRGVNEATDVLSFPANAGSRKTRPTYVGRVLLDPPAFLGEIVIARGMAREQARAFGHALATELRVLALHGLLHLLGYDHDVDNGQMGRVERRLRRRAGLPDGLIARSS
jgi:probable rRNA maturation factor